jgi:DNA-binding MarR family transcriptional regulator
MADPAVPLARLFAIGYRQSMDHLHERLNAEGWTDVRPSYGFVLLATREAPTTARAVTELLGVTKQATSQLLDQMERGGYVARDTDPHDSRAKRVVLTRRGHDLLTAVEEIYAELEREWASRLGANRVTRLRTDLTTALMTADGSMPPVRPI